jgi:hypothetical protein
MTSGGRRRASRAGGIALFALAATGCEQEATPGAAPSAKASAASSAPTKALASASAAGSVVVSIPAPPDKVAASVNPKSEAPYGGPTATLKGTIRIQGDPPADSGLTFPAECSDAAATYGKQFRVGPGGALADALVAVTGYQGYVPARAEAAKITVHRCAFARRTVAMMFGQRLEVANIGQVDSYMPYLDGAVSRATLVAIPGGEPVKLYPQQPGHYMLRDALPKPFLTADVYVLAYGTTDVSELDGTYEIPGIPVGKVRVSAFLPAIDATTETDLELKAGDNTLDLMLQNKPKEKAAAAAGSAAPKATAAPK